MTAFLKKEWMELVRTGRLWILLLLFILFGIMNPAAAKLTPWMTEIMAEQLAESGLVVNAVTVDAMTSWTQFYKNIPMALIVFVLLNSGIFTAEYQKGTLIPVVTKGLSRRRILAAKASLLFGAWTALYFLCYGITYGYNAYFWDNGIAEYPLLGALYWWLFGVWVLSWFLLFSTIAAGSTQVLFGTGAVSLAAYMLGLFPKAGTYLPVKLMDGMNLLYGNTTPGDYSVSVGTACGTAVVCMFLAVLCFDRKQL